MIRHSPCQTRGCALELHQLFIFYKHFFDDILCISTKMTLCITVKFRWDDRFAVFNDKGSIAYNSRNSNGKTYIDGTLNESTIVSALLNKKQIITIVNNDVTGDKTKTPIFFSNTDHNSGWISSAFYNSFGFDSVPTKQNDGFTEQDLIDYVLENLITK